MVGRPCQLKENTTWELKLYLGKMRTAAWEPAFQAALRSWGQVSAHNFGKEGHAQSAHIFAHGCCWSQGAVVNIHDFSAFLNVSRCEN